MGIACGQCIRPEQLSKEVNINIPDSQEQSLIQEHKNPEKNQNNQITFNSNDCTKAVVNSKPSNSNPTNNQSTNEEEVILEGGLSLLVESHKITKQNEISIVLVGNKMTGKTTFQRKLFNKKFEKEYNPTLGIDKNSKKIQFENEEFKITFIELAWIPGSGNEFENIFKDCDFILIFYDTSAKNSFEEAKEFLKKELKGFAKFYKGINSANFIFVGTKIDISPREDPIENIKNYCSRNNFDFREISSKTYKGFQELNKLIILKFKELIAVNGFN